MEIQKRSKKNGLLSILIALCIVLTIVCLWLYFGKIAVLKKQIEAQRLKLIEYDELMHLDNYKIYDGITEYNSLIFYAKVEKIEASMLGNKIYHLSFMDRFNNRWSGSFKYISDVQIESISGSLLVIGTRATGVLKDEAMIDIQAIFYNTNLIGIEAGLE